MVVYAGNSGLVLPSRPAVRKIKLLKRLINSKRAEAQRAAGINQAYEVAKANFLPEGNNRVILCTDGDLM